MASIFTIFDSNVYRGLSASAFETIVKAERARSVAGLASYFVAAELLSHLAYEGDPARRSALSGLRRMVGHCSFPQGTRQILPFLADSVDHLCYDLFGTRAEINSPEAELFGDIVQTVAASTNDAEWEHIKPACIEIAREMQAKEEEFIDSMWQRVVLGLNPAATGWEPLRNDTVLFHSLLQQVGSDTGLLLCAAMFVGGAAKEAGIHVAEAEFPEYVDKLKRRYPIPLRLYNNIIARIVRDGCNLSKRKRGNWLWDIQIAFSTGPAADIMGAPVWLITDDNDILEAGREAGAERVVRSSSAYLDLLTGTNENFILEVKACLG